MGADDCARRPADQASRRSPMGNEAAEEALMFLVDNAERAGVAKAHMIYMEHQRKVVLANLRRQSQEKTEAGRDAWARAHPEYQEVLLAQIEANTIHETMYWKRIQAEATIEAWRTKNANQRGAGRMQ